MGSRRNFKGLWGHRSYKPWARKIRRSGVNKFRGQRFALPVRDQRRAQD